MLNLRSKSDKRRRTAARLHDAVVARARVPVFYAELGVADTVDGRFDLIALHAWMALEVLRAAGLNDLSQALTDALFVGFDEGLRDLGAGDMGMGRRMKKLADAFYGRLKAYGESRDEAEMTAALERNLFRGADARHAARIARYALAARGRAAASDLAEGEIDFGPLP
jgi:cytochrome b pre-mRNA-processing protein 3